MRAVVASLPTLMLVTAIALHSATAAAQGAHEAGRRGEGLAQELSLKQRAEKRWPQPIRVGDLQGRLVIEPSNRQGSIGHVQGLVRQADGDVKLVLRTSGFLGLGVGARVIAVPIEATALLGPFVQVTDVDAAGLKALPEWTGAGSTALAADDTVRIGLNRN